MKEEYYELTAPQKSIWLTEQYYQNTNVNNVCGTFYSSEKLDFELLKKSLNIFLKNNDSFKIKLKLINNDVKQYFSDIEDIDFEIVDVKNKEEQTLLEEKLASETFMMLNSLLFKIVLFRYPDNHGGFVINSHHLISDSWTNGIVANDVAFIYSKIRNNEEYSKDTSLSYKTYIQSELDYKNSPKFTKDKEYWKQVFTAIPEVATIPSIKDTSKKEEQLDAQRLLFNIDQELFNTLKAYCDKNKVSLYNFFMTIFALYLGRVSNLDEFVIGTPILNRSNYKEKQTTGMFINTLPLKINLSHDKTFLENLRDIAVNSMSLLRHQKYSFQYIIEDLRKRDSSLPKLYNVLYSYQITKMNENMDALEHTTSWTFNKTITDDLDIHMFEWNDNNSIQIAYDYQINKYDEQDIKDLHARILHVINQILEKEDIILKDIEIVTPEEKHKILYEFNNTKVDYPKDKTIVDLFEEQVEKTPNNIAVVFEDQKLTYRELNEKANQLARYLIKKGLKENQVVSILLDKSLESIISILAVLKCKCAFLPIDIDYPNERINYIIRDSKSSILLTSQNLTYKANDTAQVLCVDLHNNQYSQYSTENVNIHYKTDNIAYVMYTSGSTGNPKGVMVTNQNVVRLVKNNKFISFSESENILQTGSIVFDACTFEIWGALLNGFKLFIMKKQDLLDSYLLEKYLIENNISILWLTAPLFNQLCENNPYMFKNVRVLLTGGDVLSPKHINLVRNACPNLTIINGYGPTENTTFSCCFTIDKEYETSIPIGKPISNSTAYVVSPSGTLCPIGVPGELWVGGDGVSKGYLNNEKLTNEKFIQNPFGEGIIYKTGDLVKWLPNGNISFIGRLDNQVKIRGFRIELSEIDSTILTYPNVKQSISIIRNINNTKTICSYIVSRENTNISNLKKYLSKTLANYMVPSYIIQLNNLPLNINGKVDKKQLPPPDINNLKKEIVHSRNNIDTVVLSSLKDILTLKNISIDDDLFNIGMDSLSSISLASNISSKLKTSISVKDIFEHSTIRDLSDFISTLVENNDKNRIKKAEKKAYYPISSAQKRIYYSSFLDNNSILYNIAGGVILDKELDKEKLEDCFQLLIKRHSSLRTYFEAKNNNIVQIVEDTINFHLDFEEVNTNNMNEIYSNFVKPFNLSKAPLFRVKLIKLKNKKSLLLIDMHHIISDGTSLNILLQELCALYNDQKLSDKKIEYKDFTIWEQGQINTKQFNESKEFWVNQFKDEIPLLNMPTVYPRPSTQSFEGSNYHTQLSKEIYKKIIEVAKELNITPYMLLLSVYYILLSKYTSQDDIIIGTPIIGRDLPELSNVLGMFVNSLPLRNKIDHHFNFEEFSKQIKENCLNSFKNQNYPFDMLVKDLDLKRDPSRNPLFDTMFIYQSEGYPAVSFDGINAEYFIPDNSISKFDLSLEIVPINNEYHLRFEYCTKLFDENFIKGFSSHYINILNTILENFEIKIADIDMLSQEEKSQILYEFNNTKVEYPKDKTIVDLFEEQVEKTPDNIAVVFENQKLTYKELNEKANQLARFLLANGANIGDIFSILLDKSLEMIISILGILKVGGTFLPIDINYPNERIDYIIRDSKSSILLTSQDLIYKANDTAQVLYVDLHNNQYSQYSTENVNLHYETDNIAYVMYTSGSTGNPKGVMVTNQNVVRLVKNNKFISFSENEHILQTGSIVFDACTFEIWGALLNGFKLFIMKKQDLLDSYLLEKYLIENNISILWLTAPLFNQLCENNPCMFKNVRVLLTGGDVLSPKHVNLVKNACPNLTIINGYGPTENTTFSCCFTIDKEYETSIPIGKPISNSTAYVVSPSGTLCPIGVPGELWVGGDGVSKGYLNNEKLTNEKFVQNPFGEGIIYKTGDLVKWLPDGNISFIGRLDNQVKIRGFRIELNEINKKILENPLIKESFTTVKVIDSGKHICSYIVTDKSLNIDDLRTYLGTYLPSYMLPTYFIKMKKLPINQNGKVDKNALPNDFKKYINTLSFKKPSNREEEILLDLFKMILKNDNISITDNFFEIGGDSLTAMKLQIEAISRNLNITYSDIFNFPTVESLAKSIYSIKDHYQKALSDFSKYDALLANNTLANEIICTKNNIGNVLLTGFTGFLGAHILDSFIKEENGKIYCLIRSKNNMSAKERLFNVLHFYFESKYDNLVDDRIILVEGDITLENLGLSNEEYNMLTNNISTIIHSAALVKHYGIYKDFEKININGTKNIINLAEVAKAKLLHISTISVSGNNLAEGSNIDNYFGKEMEYNETNFYIGQNLDNLYVRSKFEAEKLVFDAIMNKGVNACVLRMGNLTSRFSEGKFQRNHFENAFVNRLRSFLQIGIFPKNLLDLYCEFTPIDYCGDAIISIANYFNKKYTVFHLLNEKHVYLDRLFTMLKEIGINIKFVSESEFSTTIQNLLNDPEKRYYVEGIINDLSSDKRLTYKSEVNIQSNFSKEFLYKTGFEWPYIDVNYIRNYFKYLIDIGYFNTTIN